MLPTLDNFFQQRNKVLKLIALEDVLRDSAPHLLRCYANNIRIPSEIVPLLVEDYLVVNCPSAPAETVELINSHSLPSYWEYHALLPVVWNRILREFFSEFTLPSGQIDWPKLVQFNSGNKPQSSGLVQEEAADYQPSLLE